MKKRNRIKTSVPRWKTSNQLRSIVFLVLAAALLGGATQMIRIVALTADTAPGISYTSTIPSNTDASREGRSYQANVSYTGATGLQAKFLINNEGASRLIDVTFFITAPSLVTLDDAVTFSDPALKEVSITFTERSLGDTLEFEIPELNVSTSLEITFYFDTTGITISSPQEVSFQYLVTGKLEGYGEPLTLIDEFYRYSCYFLCSHLP
jgi:hypothetical protein